MEGAAKKWASGRWKVKQGSENEFIERWKEWLGWTSTSVPGFRSAKLIQSDDDSSQFTSFSDWAGDAELQAWKTSDDFRQKFGAVRELCDDVQTADFDLAAEFSSETVTG